MRGRRRIVTSLALAVLGPACASAAGSGTGGPVQVIGSFYPLAWVAERIGGGRVHVQDFTPPGVEAHDTSLSARQVADVENADVVLLLGSLGFQPQVEQAARRSSGRVVQVTQGIHLRPSNEQGLSADPHVWLDPVLMERIAREVSNALMAIDPKGRGAYQQGAASVTADLAALDTSYRSTLHGCRYASFVTTHEAFGYLADEYGLTQIGIEGLTPEAEPTAAQLRTAQEAISSGRAAPAVFYEGTNEGERIGRSVASSVHVPALPLGTLEFDPAPGDYLSVMRSNLANLAKGLRCG